MFVGQWMITRRETHHNSQGLIYSPPNLRNKLGSPVRNYVRGNSMQVEDMVNEQVGHFSDCAELGKRHNMQICPQ